MVCKNSLEITYSNRLSEILHRSPSQIEMGWEWKAGCVEEQFTDSAPGPGTSNLVLSDFYRFQKVKNALKEYVAEIKAKTAELLKSLIISLNT